MKIITWLKNIFAVLKEAGKIKEYEKISFLTDYEDGVQIYRPINHIKNPGR